MPVSWLYGKIADYRNALYEKGVFKSFSLGAPTVSIGNLTVGGTGKTPLVALTAKILAENGGKICILTRGYGRENPKQRVLVSNGEKILADVKRAGDEPLELARQLLGKALVIADADRTAAADWALKNFSVKAFVLDDAFQHRRVKRDLDIVTIDAAHPFGNRKTLPAGILREPLANLKRAGLIVVTRANLIGRSQISDLKAEISNLDPGCPIFVSENKISNLVELEKFNADPGIRQSARSELPDLFQEAASRFETKNALAFCALGHPENFFEQLRREKINVISTQKFPDHHFYTPKDLAALEKKALESGAEILLTTAKDAVKLKDLQLDVPCFVVENTMIFDDKKKLREIINAVLDLKS